MTQEDIENIKQIIGNDKAYTHFITRIKKDLSANQGKDRTKYIILYQQLAGERIGFCVISSSIGKMKAWEQFLKEETPTNKNFQIIATGSFELVFLYMKPNFRKQGHGKILFQKAYDFARQANATALYAYTSDKGNNIIDFYKKNSAHIIYQLEDDETNIKTAFLSWNI